MTVEHLSGYQARDREVIDYELYRLPGTELWFRGPEDPAATADPSVVCLGAAQTFGCFAERPYPRLLADRFSVPVLNLGYGGAGPEFYLRHPELIERANRASVAVVQVMSGRSVTNARFRSDGLEYLRRRSDGQRVSAEDAYTEIVYGRVLAHRPLTIPVRAARKAAARARTRTTRALVAETRANWVADYQGLLSRLTVPVVLAWFSVRSPDLTDDYSTPGRLLGRFPQLVNRQMLDALAPLVDEVIECTTDVGLPQPLYRAGTSDPVTVDPADDRPDLGGSVWTHNTYYPSPEMHQALALALEGACGRHLG